MIGDVVALGLEVAELGADGDVGVLVVEERVLLIVGEDVVELDLELVIGVEAVRRCRRRA